MLDIAIKFLADEVNTHLKKRALSAVSYTHLTLPTSDLV